MFDHTHALLAQALTGQVTDVGVRYDTLPRAPLDAYLHEVATAPIASFTADEKTAVWIDAYNAFTLVTVLDAMPIASILELDGGKVWDTRQFVLGGERLTLNQLEHERLRQLGDPRVHAALNCASKGCPPLWDRPYTADGLSAQLDAASERWARTTAVRLDGTSIGLSHVFEWYSADFAASARGDVAQADTKQDAALGWLSRHVADDIAKQLLSGALPTVWIDYDWALNHTR